MVVGVSDEIQVTRRHSRRVIATIREPEHGRKGRKFTSHVGEPVPIP